MQRLRNADDADETAVDDNSVVEYGTRANDDDDDDIDDDDADVAALSQAGTAPSPSTCDRSSIEVELAIPLNDAFSSTLYPLADTLAFHSSS